MSRSDVERKINRLIDLWERERRTARERYTSERRRAPLSERVARGIALRGLTLDEIDAAPGDRTLLWISTGSGKALDRIKIGPGDPVRLWWDEPDSRDAILGTVARKRGGRLGVMISGDPDPRLEEGSFKLDLDDPGETFRRGLRALGRFRDAKGSDDRGRMAMVLFGGRAPEFDKERAFDPFDTDLNGPQSAAVTRALAARDVALIHGPPGTGKTRTLVEVVRQAVARGDRVLATAASNAAVDNLAERLVDAGASLVRLGHPARVSDKIEPRTLDALLEKSDSWKLTRRWMAEAAEIRRRTAKRSARGSLSRAEQREGWREARKLVGDARRLLRAAQEAIVASCDVVCATAAGADQALLGAESFDLVVLDEATQATDPIALVALGRAPRAVMAGDPCQLPPTVLDLKASREGLGTTFFERLRASHQSEAVRMLTVQHRMHESIMAFPSESHYDGQLVAAPHVEKHTLADLDVADDPQRPGPFVFIDTSGKGWDELRTEDDPSLRNPDQAQRTVEEVHRLLQRGLSPRNLAVISPYLAQVRLLRELLPELVASGLEVGTIDGFQGREKEAIILDLVRSNANGEIGFLSDTRRMNVALTRARRFLLVIGDSATIGGLPYYSSFLDAVDVYGSWQSAWD